MVKLVDAATEIKRIDPYALAWSADGAVALASESASVQVFSVDAAGLLQGTVKWTRARAPKSVTARVLDLAWSATHTSSSGHCLLACVLQTGDAVVLDACSSDELTIVYTLVGSYSAVTWLSRKLVLGDNDGNVYVYNRDGDLEASLTVQPRGTRSGHRVLGLEASRSSESALVVFGDNSVWILDLSADSGTRTGTIGSGTPARAERQIVPASRFHVDSLAFTSTDVPVVARTGSVVAGGTEVRTASFLPGSLVTDGEAWALVHRDGTVTQPPSSPSLPKLKGNVLGIASHPHLPMGIVTIGPETNDWEYPILSWQTLKLAVFPLHSPLVPVSVMDAPAEAWWLAALVKNEALAENSAVEPPATEGRPLVDRLSALFTSAWFDAQRVRWYTSTAEDRGAVVNVMRQQIAAIVCSEATASLSLLDRAVQLWYSAYLDGTSPSESLPGQMRLSIRSEFAAEEFTVRPVAEVAATSESGCAWKRCDITLLPLLSLDSWRSLDGEFTAYRRLPHIDAASTDSAASIPDRIVPALLSAADFCVFTGTQWAVPRRI